MKATGLGPAALLFDVLRQEVADQEQGIEVVGKLVVKEDKNRRN
jgi:hypothetical protein